MLRMDALLWVRRHARGRQLCCKHMHILLLNRHASLAGMYSAVRQHIAITLRGCAVTLLVYAVHGSCGSCWCACVLVQAVEQHVRWKPSTIRTWWCNCATLCGFSVSMAGCATACADAPPALNLPLACADHSTNVPTSYCVQPAETAPTMTCNCCVAERDTVISTQGFRTYTADLM